MTTIEGVKTFVVYAIGLLLLGLVIFLIWLIIPSKKERQEAVANLPTIPVTYVGDPSRPAALIDVQPGQPHFVVFTGRQKMRAEPKNGPILMTAVTEFQVETSEKIMVTPGQNLDATKSFKYSPDCLKLEVPPGTMSAVRVHVYPERW
jgi:hypothetical protein